MKIRPYKNADWPRCHEIIRAAFDAGDSYPYPGDMPETYIRSMWISVPNATFVAVNDDGAIIGTYYIKANQAFRGAHVCNCGYIVDAAGRGQGVATAMCEHSQAEAVRLGFSAMQFNYVVASNVGAVQLWQRLGFDIIGTLPGVFDHKELGMVDAHVMFKSLA